MRLLPPRIVALATLALAAACGPGSYGEFRDQLVGASCAWGLRCGVVPAGDRAHCKVDQVLRTFHDSLGDHQVPGAIDIAASIDNGRMRYDSVNAQSCLDAVSGAPCEPVLAARRISLACNAVVAPHTETDRPCWGDSECTGGVCARVQGCAGICAAYASYTDPCISSMIAPAAMQCDPTVAFCGPLSQDGAPICQQKKPEGADCTDTVECSYNWTCRVGHCTQPKDLDENAVCGGSDPCKADTFCSPLSGLCERRHKEGEACTSQYGCGDNLGCLGFASDGMGHVVAQGVCGRWLVPGAACSQLDAMTVSGCPDSAPCTKGVCTPGPALAGRDENCTDKPCAEGLGCDADKRCDFLRQIFGECGGPRATLCDVGLVCAPRADNPNDHACVPVDALACFQPAKSS